MVCVLTYVGLSFLSRQCEYLGLLVDGVSLVFIVEIEELLYERAVFSSRQKKYENYWDDKALEVNLDLPPFMTRRSHPSKTWRDLAWVSIIMIAAVIYMLHLNAHVVQPVYESLTCACLNEGPNCREAQVYNHNWWEDYWRVQVPESLKQIESVKQTAEIPDQADLINMTAWGQPEATQDRQIETPVVTHHKHQGHQRMKPKTNTETLSRELSMPSPNKPQDLSGKAGSPERSGEGISLSLVYQSMARHMGPIWVALEHLLAQMGS